LYEFIIADILSRFYKGLIGDGNAVLNVGVDEHGIKVQQASQVAGINPKDYCDELTETWKKFCQQFSIGYDNFYRTSDVEHERNAVKYFEDLKKRGLVYKKQYTGFYCVGCESFITSKEIVDGKCPVHGTEVKQLSEENYFLNIGKFKNEISTKLTEPRYLNELQGNKEGFDEISVTRKNIDWAIQLDNGDSLYVWFEALLNYIFAAGYGTEVFDELWRESVILCGKDNLKFQAYILPSLLSANGIAQNKEVWVHGTVVDAQGQKISKTVGNVIDPIEQLEKFGQSPLRYFFFKAANHVEVRYDEKQLVDLWNKHIVDGLGNLLSRALHLIDIKNVNTDESLGQYQNKLDALELRIDEAFLRYDFSGVYEQLILTVDELNKRITEEKPYSKECPNPGLILNEVYHTLRLVTKYYGYVLPEYREQFHDALKNKKKTIIFSKYGL
jgi:methionyl-tRNA synthetase